MSATTRFDFGTSSSPVAAGQTQVTESTQYSSTLGYGWTAGTLKSGDRGTSDALTRDFNFSSDASFAVDLANGTYLVTLTLGDAKYAHDQMGVYLEGALLESVSNAKGQFVTKTYSVTVTDGQLTLRLRDLGGSDPNIVLNALEITGQSIDPPPATAFRFDFGTSSSPVAAGQTQVTESTAYSSALGYGWTSGTLKSSDRGTSDALTRDFNFSSDASFAVDLANGTYLVTLTLGDAKYAHDQMGVYLEGTLLESISNAKGQFVTKTYSVTVTDGQLTLRLRDLGGSDPNIVLNALEISSESTSGDTTPPVVTVTSPNGGESWTVGSTQQITWTASDNMGVASVDLFYSTDGGGSYTLIAAGVANTGSYAWTVPNAVTSAGRIRVLARDAAGNTTSDSSNASFSIAAAASSASIYVSKTGSDTGTGAEGSPFATIAHALTVVKPGQTIIVRAGTYSGTISTQISGTANQRITIKAETPGTVILTNTGRVLNVRNPYYTIEGIIFDGQFGASDIITVSSTGDYLQFRSSEVRNGIRDGIDISGADHVLIEGAKIHHLLWMSNGVREDAHGIVSSGGSGLTIRSTEIFYVSGDALQLQYGGWDNVLVDQSHFWNGPLPTAVAGFPAGVYAGENAIDTKQYGDVSPGRLTVTGSTFNGWHSSYISNAAAFVLKHNVNVIVDGNTFFDNEIALRLRGPGDLPGAVVLAMNNVFYENNTAIRYEDGIQNLRIYNNTFGGGNDRLFQSAGGYGTGFSVQNNLFLAANKPTEASPASNLAVTASAFINAAQHDYHLAAGAAAINSGESLALVTTDRDGLPRPNGARHDVGAYEYSLEQLFATFPENLLPAF